MLAQTKGKENPRPRFSRRWALNTAWKMRLKLDYYSCYNGIDYFYLTCICAYESVIRHTFTWVQYCGIQHREINGWSGEKNKVGDRILSPVVRTVGLMKRRKDNINHTGDSSRCCLRHKTEHAFLTRNITLQLHRISNVAEIVTISFS